MKGKRKMRATVERMGNVALKFFVDQVEGEWMVLDRSLMTEDGKFPEKARMWSGMSIPTALKVCGELNEAFMSKKSKN